MPGPIRTRAQFDALIRSLTNYERMPEFHAGRVRADLEQMRRHVERLGHPEAACPAVHVTGTKGKGSTATFVARVLERVAGPVGLHTSPHLERLEERVAVDSAPIDDAGLFAAANDVLGACAVQPEAPFPTFFEFMTLAAMLEFRRRATRFAVHEVGMGGTLDATNVLHPAAAVVTNVELEHVAVLGGTREAIAREKVGIVKEGCTVVTGVHASDPVHAVLCARAAETGATLRTLGRDVVVERFDTGGPGGTIRADVVTWRSAYRGLEPAVFGAHQAENLALAIGALEALRERGLLDADPGAIAAAVKGIALPGRLEPFNGRPLVLVDGAHTPGSVARAMEAVLAGRFSAERPVVILGMAADKDHAAAAMALAGAASVVTTGYDNPRAVPADRLARIVAAAGVRVEPAAGLADALRRARARAGAEGVVLVLGSLYLAGAARALLRDETRGHARPAEETAAWNT